MIITKLGNNVILVGGGGSGGSLCIQGGGGSGGGDGYSGVFTGAFTRGGCAPSKLDSNNTIITKKNPSVELGLSEVKVAKCPPIPDDMCVMPSDVSGLPIYNGYCRIKIDSVKPYVEGLNTTAGENVPLGHWGVKE